MQVKRRKQRRRGSLGFKVLLALVLMAGLSYAGATLWQSTQEAGSSGPEEGVIRYSTGPSQAAAVVAEASLSEPAASSGEETSAPQPQPSEPSEAPQPGDANFSAPPGQSAQSTVTGAFGVEGQVPESDKAPNSYFDDAIFFGDSISTGISAYNIAQNTACVAAIGVSPSTILNTPYIPTRDGGKLTLLEAAKEHGPRSKVYIMLGGNGLWEDRDSFISNYQAFIDEVKKQYPDAVVYLQSMTPVARGVEQHYPSVTHEKVLEYNGAIAQLAKDNNLPFVNVFEALCAGDGRLPDGVSADGLHLSAEYYYKWFDYLKTHTIK